jgi:hypothetical protein
VAFAYYVFKINAVLAFWAAYILTRPLGASAGDLLSQPASAGGLGLGTTWTSLAFLIVIAALTVFMTVQQRRELAAAPATEPERGAMTVLSGQIVRVELRSRAARVFGQQPSITQENTRKTRRPGVPYMGLAA